MGFFDWLRGMIWGGQTTGFLEEEPAAREPISPKSTREPATAATLLPGLPPLQTVGDLAVWLGTTPGKLQWLAHPNSHGPHTAPSEGSARSQHYYETVRTKRNGAPRYLGVPKTQLKSIQRKILQGILDKVPLSDRAHGFRPSRSTLTNAGQHVGREIVLHFDLAHFFNSINARRITGVFVSLGYPREVATTLMLLCTYEPHPEVKQEFKRSHNRVVHRCLPQGAPTSPAISNVICRKLDARLSGLARRFGVAYTRYADDLTFSGGRNLIAGLKRFIPLVKRIIRSERFCLAKEKSRIARKGNRQSVTGIVVNSKPGVSRRQRRKLRAILHNCETQGPRSQNVGGRADFRAHLQGWVSYVRMVDADQGEKLQEAFDRVDWG